MSFCNDGRHKNHSDKASVPPAKRQGASTEAPLLAEVPEMTKLPPSLEALPTEILQIIFWESLEINMIFTSKRIALRLPDFKSTARILLLLAYTRVRVWTSFRLSRAELIPLHSMQPLDPVQRMQLQHSIMDGDWLTVDMLKNTLLEIIEGCVRTFCTRMKIATLDDWKEMSPYVWRDNVRLSETQLCFRYIGVPGSIDDISFYGGCFVGLCCANPRRCKYSALDVKYIPDKLLEPPFDHRKIEILLVLLGAKYQRDRETVDMSRSMLETRIREAIEQGNSDVALLLVDLAFQCFGRYVRPADFELAARCDHSDVLERLVSFDSHDFPRDNVCIERWAKAARDLGSRFGHVLHEYMLADLVKQRSDSFTRFQRYSWPRYVHEGVSSLMRRNGALARLGPKYGL